MRFAYFLSFFDKQQPEKDIDTADFDRVVDIVSNTPALARGLIFRAERSVGRYYPNDDTPPQLAMELYFDRIEDLERALAPEGHLRQLAAPSVLPGLQQAEVQQQAMVVRRFKGDKPGEGPQQNPFCTFLVHYPGTADDFNAWIDHYIRYHAAIMTTFPGIREVEVCTRLDWRGFLPWPRVNYMQRNKVVFDSAEALIAAMSSPVRAEMTADFNSFPPFHGGNVHYPLVTTEIVPGA